MSDITIGSPQFKVILSQMEGAIGTLDYHRSLLSTARDNINMAFGQATQSWDSPAGDGFNELLPKVKGNMDDLMNALDTISGRLRTTHQNYLDAEEANSSALTPPASGPTVTSAAGSGPGAPPPAGPQKFAGGKHGVPSAPRRAAAGKPGQLTLRGVARPQEGRLLLREESA
jgi:WXG100 family type VII secretion target